VVRVEQWQVDPAQQVSQPALTLGERPFDEILAVGVQEVEQEEYESVGVTAVRSGLNHIERGRAVRAHAAQLAVEICLRYWKGSERLGDSRIFLRPIEAGSGQQPHVAVIQASVHPVAVELDLVQPLGAGWRLLDQFTELRLHEDRQRISGRTAASGVA